MRKRVLRKGYRSPSWLNMHNLLAAGFAVLFGLSVILLAGAMGFKDGLQQRKIEQQAAIARHIELGEKYLSQGDKELARAEFSLVLRLDPTNEVAYNRIRQIDSEMRKEGGGSKPSSTPGAIDQAANQAFQNAKAAFEKSDWSKAIVYLNTVREIDPYFRQGDVTALLFKSYVNLGRQLIEQGNIEEGVRDLQAARKIRPEDENLKKEIELATEYLNGLGYRWVDWDKVIQALSDVYSKDPKFLDVKAKLAEAYAEKGNFLVKKGQACQGVKSIRKALEIEDSAQWKKYYYKADYACKHPTPTPVTGTVGSEVTPAPGTPAVTGVPFGPGVVFSEWDAKVNRYHLMLFPLAGEKPVLIADDISQPAVSRDGAWIAGKSWKADALGIARVGIHGDNRIRVTQFAEDGFPSWSPDGKKIVFASQREGDRRWRVYVTWADGKSQATNICFGKYPAWAPSGNTIAYQGCDPTGNNCGLYLRDLESGAMKRLTQDLQDTAPTWSPNGGRIAYMHLSNGQWDIYLLDLKTGKSTPLVSTPANEGMPAWSPDGRELAYLADVGGHWGIYVLDFASHNSTLLYTIPDGYSNWMNERISWVR